jgi:hypothetical protein
MENVQHFWLESMSSRAPTGQSTTFPSVVLEFVDARAANPLLKFVSGLCRWASDKN